MVYPSGARAVCLMFPWKAALKRFELFVVLLDELVGESMERMLWAENAAEDNPGWCFSPPHPNTHDLLLGPAVTPMFFFANVAPFQAVKKICARCAPPRHQQRHAQGDGQPRLLPRLTANSTAG